MNQIIQAGGSITMSSAEMVEFINDHRKEAAFAVGAEFPSKGYAKLEHADFVKKVPEVLGKDAGKFSGIYRDSMNRVQDGYHFPKREACLMAMSYSYALQAKVFDRMTALEAASVPLVVLPGDYIQALEQLLESKKSEQRALEDRDHAIATKAQIGSKREATAMATASAAKREVLRLKEELGVNQRHATIIAVEKALHTTFGSQFWRNLKRWCDEHGVAATKVVDPRWGEVKAWPAEAWKEVQGVDLASIFPAPEGLSA